MQGHLSGKSLSTLQSLLPDQFDFTRCVRPNGTAYGTGGRCRIGTESALQAAPGGPGRPRKARKPLAAMTPTEKRKELDRRLRETVREVRKGDPEKLRQQWVKDHNRGKVPDKFPSSLRMAKDIAARKVKADAKAELAGTASKPKPTPTTQPTPKTGSSHLDQLGSHYKALAELRKQKLPSGEEEWRKKEIDDRIRESRDAAIQAAQKLEGKARERALKRIEEEDFKGFAASRSQDELYNEIGRLLYEHSDIRGTGSKEKLKEMQSKLDTLAGHITNPSMRAMYETSIGYQTGRLKQEGPGTLASTQKAGTSLLQKHDEGLRSTVSILRKADAVETTIRQRIEKLKEEKPPGWIKERVRLSSMLMRVAQHRGNATQRLNAKMEGIRKEMLQTNLSDIDIARLLDRISMKGAMGSKYKPTQAELAESRAHIEEFARMFNGKGLSEVYIDGDRRQHFSQFLLDPTQRAHAYANTGSITSNGKKQTMFHEIGHIVEGQRPWLQDTAVRWRDSRAFSLQRAQSDPESQLLVGDGKTAAVPYRLEKLPSTRQEVPIYKLDDMLPLRGKGYDSKEIAVVDRFFHPYLGKRYTDDLTEVVSMTVEHFAEPHLMAHLYRHHPDLFTLGVGLSQT